jgi:phosphoglycolate phosphatase
MQKYTHIIWDWNGTLLDDVAWCMKSINVMLKKRGLPTLNSVEAYHRVFGFPVIDYYRRVGFDFEKEPFEKLAIEYIELYHDIKSDALLFPEAKEVLADFQNKGIHQIILSASEMKNLLSQMEPFEVDSFFDEVLGIPDIFATSKIDLGKAYIKRTQPERAV